MCVQRLGTSRREGNRPHLLAQGGIFGSLRGPLCLDSSRLSSLSRDRKSTRLNSSHQIISYAVFCLKKKKKLQHSLPRQTYRAVPISPAAPRQRCAELSYFI